MMINIKSLKKRKKELVVEEGELFIMAAKRDDGIIFVIVEKGYQEEKRESNMADGDSSEREF